MNPEESTPRYVLRSRNMRPYQQHAKERCQVPSGRRSTPAHCGSTLAREWDDPTGGLVRPLRGGQRFYSRGHDSGVLTMFHRSCCFTFSLTITLAALSSDHAYRNCAPMITDGKTHCFCSLLPCGDVVGSVSDEIEVPARNPHVWGLFLRPSVSEPLGREKHACRVREGGLRQ